MMDEPDGWFHPRVIANTALTEHAGLRVTWRVYCTVVAYGLVSCSLHLSAEFGARAVSAGLANMLPYLDDRQKVDNHTQNKQSNSFVSRQSKGMHIINMNVEMNHENLHIFQH